MLYLPPPETKTFVEWLYKLRNDKSPISAFLNSGDANLYDRFHKTMANKIDVIITKQCSWVIRKGGEATECQKPGDYHCGLCMEHYGCALENDQDED